MKTNALQLLLACAAVFAFIGGHGGYLWLRDRRRHRIAERARRRAKEVINRIDIKKKKTLV